MMRGFICRYLLAAGLAVVAPATLDAQPSKTRISPKPEVTRLRFQGVENVKQDELRLNVSTDVSHCRSFILKPACLISKSKYVYAKKYLDRDELARDILRIRVFYWKRGFRDAAVDTVVAPGGRNKVAVTFRITEGAPTLISRINVLQDSNVLSKREIDKRVVLSQGAPLNLLRLDSTRVFLQSRMWDKGFGDAEVDTAVVIDEVAHRADLTFTLRPRWKTTVADVTIEGERRVAERTIRRSLTFKPGDVYKRSEILRSQRQLYESNLFKRALLEVPKQADSNKVVIVTVQEAPLRENRLSAGFSNVDFFQLEGRFTHYNFRGGARRLVLSGALGNLFASSLNGRFVFRDITEGALADRSRYLAPTYNASAEIRQPWFGSPHNEIALSVFTHRRSAPGIFVDRGYGSSFTFTRMLTERAPASANYRFEQSSVEAGDVYFCINYGVCDRPTLNALRERQRMSPLTLTSFIDRTNDPFSPNRGYRARLDAEHASGVTFSDFRYNRATADFAAYYQIRSRGALAGHLRGGWVSALASTREALGTAPGGDVLHPRKRFYSGGARSVRGFGENQLGPRVLTIPAKLLRDKDSSTVCQASVLACSPNVSGLRNRDFEPRPLGGNVVLEASAEVRFPVWRQLIGAAFVDAGMVSQRINRDLPRSRAVVTPGFGVRYRSPVGPIRADIGINPGKSETLPVVTEQIIDGEVRLVKLPEARRYTPIKGLMNRMTLHLSIGEAF